MTNNQSPNWTYLLALGLAAAVLSGFLYSVNPVVQKPATKSNGKPWGVLARFSLGEEWAAAKKKVQGASSIKNVGISGPLQQETLKVQWGNGEHLLTLVFAKRRLQNAYEVSTVRDQMGKILRRQWQGFSMSQPDLESGELKDCGGNLIYCGSRPGSGSNR